MRQQRIITKPEEIDGGYELATTLFHLLSKCVRVNFDDSTRRIAKLTKLIGHEIKINNRGGRFVLDSLELDGDASDLADMRRIVSVDNLEENIG